MSETLLSAWSAARDRLKAAGVDSPVLDARMLIEDAAGVTRLDIVTDPYRELSAAQLAAIEAHMARRAAREPVSYILGKKAFWKSEFTVSPAVLSPRPETELVVETALTLVGEETPARALDLGTGSGAIAISLLIERPMLRAVGVDFSAEALAIARFNAVAQIVADRLELRTGDWAEGLGEGAFDLVVSNPPYIRSGAIDLLAPEVSRYEPRAALDGGPDGLAAYRALAPALARVLKPGGGFALEIGEGQAEAVWAHLDAAGLTPLGVREDLAAIPRVVFGRKA